VNDLSRAVSLIVLLALLVGCAAEPSPESIAQPVTLPPATRSQATPTSPATEPPPPAPAPSPVPPPTEPVPSPEALARVDVTIVYDNTVYDGADSPDGLAAEWGFAAWVEYGDHTILFDTGPGGSVLLHNLELLGLDPQAIDLVVLSHIHEDHTGGLNGLLGAGVQPLVYAPRAFPVSFKQSIRSRTELVEVLDPVEILPGLYTTGQLGGDPAEQALVAQTSEGTVVITGCAHPGILRIVRQTQSQVPGETALVLGGFHLLPISSDTVTNIVTMFREYGVKQVSPTHCTGQKAVGAFASEYAQDYLEAGVGRVFVVGAESPSAGAANPNSVAYWPAGDWRTSTPEEQGMDSELLAGMLAQIQQEGHAIDSVQVVRNGHLVVDAYVSPFGPGRKHPIHSCTKSIVSTLIGIAIEQGYLEGTGQPVLELLPGRTIAHLDAAKEAMTLEDVLIMATGLECRDSYLYRWRGLQQMRQSDDWVQFMLDLPMAEEPGTRFEYCNGASFLLSAILQEATGKSAAEFADEHLFGPLGIDDVTWPSNPQGISIGWGEVQMQPHDMARLGHLYLSQGRWGDQQIIPPDWVERSIRKQIPATLQDGYGYQWWVSQRGYYMALGYAGQFIFVVPGLDLVVVFLSDLEERDFYVPQQLLDGYIIPAARSVEPLAANPDGAAELEARTNALAGP
jgi:metal-dependent hydrolase (beta-lactamase superfamily II)/CubicO group peptidase (beta-lactamase class C family)